ncbi:MAG TPA: glucoamylase family protein [Elusimicrobiota bacterium]|nr:glucoamylase family protein [Elusimicrobiota bacterium]
MKRIHFLLWLGLLCPVLLSAETKLSQEDEKARLIRFSPVKLKQIDAGLPERQFLLQIASDTWGYFRDIVDRETGLPLDNIIVTSSFTKVNSYTSTTNIGLYLMCVVSAVDLGFLAPDEAVGRIRAVLTSLGRMECWDDHFYNYYATIDFSHKAHYVSSVDNGWLVAGLIIARQAFPEHVGVDADALIKQVDFSKLYAKDLGHLYLGYDGDKGEYPPYTYGLFCTEPRATSYIAIAKGDVPRDHWWRISRTFPPDNKWQQQTPKGRDKMIDGSKVFSGYYRVDGVAFVPSWGGSLFEFLMPTLVLDEQGLAPKGLGLNNSRVLDLQIYYALNEKRYPVWGFSPCAVPDESEGYREYGVPYLGSKGYPDEGVVTPHVSFLALMVDAPKAVENIRTLLEYPDIYGEYGFYDSVNVMTGRCSARYLCLDQAMTLIALNNYLNDRAVQKRFHSYPPVQAQEDLLSLEKFY